MVATKARPRSKVASFCIMAWRWILGKPACRLLDAVRFNIFLQLCGGLFVRSSELVRDADCTSSGRII